MKILIDKSFERDLKKLHDKNVQRNIAAKIREVESSKSLSEISKVKKLEGEKNYYRIRIGDYRIGFQLKDNTAIFERCLNRKEIYRYYPPNK